MDIKSNCPLIVIWFFHRFGSGIGSAHAGMTAEGKFPSCSEPMSSKVKGGLILLDPSNSFTSSLLNVFVIGNIFIF